MAGGGLISSISSISNSSRGIGSSIYKMKNPNNFATASVELANSAINLAGSIGSLQRGINDLFYNDRDVINQDMNIMTGNNYISGYEKIPFQPLMNMIIPDDAKEIMGMKQDIRTQPMVDYDMENFKYSLDRQTDNTDYYYEDPLFVSFDLMFDDMESPLFTEVDNFFETYYTNNDNIAFFKAWSYYDKFKQLFWKIFNSTSHPDKKSNKVWYINSITGLDKLTSKIPKYTEDKLTITLSEDIAMLVNYLVDSYNNFAYNYRDQRYNLPDNLLRFKMMIQFTDMRTMKLLDHFETPGYMYDKATQIYTLYDCNFDFFNSKNFADEVINGGYGASKNDTPATVKFDIIYKSIQKEFRTPLLKGERDNIVDNKEYDVSSRNILNFRSNLKRTDENELELKDILKNAFGIANSLNNMLQDYIPKIPIPIPSLPPDVLGTTYESVIPVNKALILNQDTDDRKINPLAARKKLIEDFTKSMEPSLIPNLRITGTTINSLGYDFEQIIELPRSESLKNVFENNVSSPLPVYTNLGFIELFLKSPFSGNLGEIELYLKPTFSGNLGEIELYLKPPFSDDLGYNYQNISTPTHDNLGILPFITNPFVVGNLGYDFQNISNQEHENLGILPFIINPVIVGNLGYDYQNLPTILHGDLGIEFENNINIVPQNLGNDYLNIGKRPPIPDIILFGGSIINPSNLGYIYTNIQELTNINLGINFDNTVKRQLTSLNTLYNNFIKKQEIILGNDFTNLTKIKNELNLGNSFDISEKINIELKLLNVYDNVGQKNNIDNVVLFEKSEKQISELNNIFDNVVEKKSIINMGESFIGVEKSLIDDMGEVFTGTEKLPTNDMGEVFTGTEKLPTNDMGEVFTGTEKLLTNDMGEVFTGTEKLPINDMGEVFIGTEKLPTNDMGEVFTGTEKLLTNDMGEVFTGTEKLLTNDMGEVFTGTEKLPINDMGEVFTGTEKLLTNDMGEVFTGGEKSLIDDMGEVFTGTEKLPINDMGEVFIGVEKSLIDNIGEIYSNLQTKNKTNMDDIFINNIDKQDKYLKTTQTGDVLGYSYDKYGNLIPIFIHDEENETVTTNIYKSLDTNISDTTKKEIIFSDMGQVFNGINQPPIADMGQVFNGINQLPIEDMGRVFNGMNQPPIEDMGQVFNGINQPPIEDMGQVFNGMNQPPIEDMGQVFKGINQPPIEDMGQVFNGINQPPIEDMGQVFNGMNQPPIEDMGQVFNGMNQPPIEDMGQVFNGIYDNNIIKDTKLDDETVFIQKQEQKSEINLGNDFTNKSDNKKRLNDDNIYEQNNEKQSENLGKTYENNLDDE